MTQYDGLRNKAEVLIEARSRADAVEPKDGSTYGQLSLYHDALTDFQREASPEVVIELLDALGAG